MALSRLVSSEVHRLFPDQHFYIEKYTFGEQARKCMDKTKSRYQREEILKCVCALLNSGGGVISVGIENEDYGTMVLGGDMEEHLTQLVTPSVIQDFIEVRPFANDLLLYVKSWCPDSQRAKLCSVDSGLRERSGSTTPSITPNAFLDFIKKKHGQVVRKPFAKKLRQIEGNTLITQKAQQFYDEEKAVLGEIVDFGESENVELKSFNSEKNLEKRLKEALPKYLSAFANTNRGYLFIGVDDKTKRVVGCGKGMDVLKVEQMVQDICDKGKTRAFHLLHCAKTSDWSIGSKVFKVMENSNEEPRYIIAIRIPVFCCVVFEEDPKCWHVENGAIKRLNAESWLEKMQLSDPDDDLSKRFEKVLSLRDSPPQCRPVYSTQHISQLQEGIFSVQGETTNIIHESVPDELFVKYSNLLPKHVDLKSGPGVLIMSTSWAADINLPRNNEIICEALLVSAGSYPTLFSWVERESAELWQNVTETAFHLKQKLVNLGGFTGRLCVIPQLVNSQTGELFKKKKTDDAPLYPDSYRLDDEDEVVALLRSLTIVLLSFSSPLSDTLGYEFFNLLTKEQFHILHGFSGIKRLFIHGPPGSGKTLIAMEKIRRIRNSDSCDQTNVLYLCENVGLRDFVRKQKICLCETRASFMKPEKTFDGVKHIIVDEGQNFRLEDGDWYKKAKSLIEGKSGFFWIFLDYCQRSHIYGDGLPVTNVQDKVSLSEVVRNSTEVFNVMSDLIDNIAANSKPNEAEHLRKMRENIRLSHPFKGRFVHMTNLSSVEQTAVKIIRGLLRVGHSARDIAVLFSTVNELDKRQYSIRKEKLPVGFGSVEDIDQDVVVLDTIRRFSGLERNIVIVVDPTVHPSQNEIQTNILLSAFSRARIRLYVLQSRSQSQELTGVNEFSGTFQ